MHISETELVVLIKEFQPLFAGGQRALIDSWGACKKFYADKHLLLTEPSVRRWFKQDAERDAVLSYRFPPEADDPLAEAHPQQHLDLTEVQLRRAVAAGDLHNWYFLEDPAGTPDEARQSMLSVDQHVRSCPRCQKGAESRTQADAIAANLGKPPFPGLGNLMHTFDHASQRCDDCPRSEDELADDDCPRALWHLPDIWLALPQQPGAPWPRTLENMGKLGPFMRGFLRWQRLT